MASTSHASYYDVTDLTKLPDLLTLPEEDGAAVYAEPSTTTTLSDDIHEWDPFRTEIKSSLDLTQSIQLNNQIPTQNFETNHPHANGYVISKAVGLIADAPTADKYVGHLKISDLPSRIKRQFRDVTRIPPFSYTKFSKKMSGVLLRMGSEPSTTEIVHHNTACCSDDEGNYGFAPQPLSHVERKIEQITGIKLTAPPNLRSVRMLRSGSRNVIETQFPKSHRGKYLLNRPLSSFYGQDADVVFDKEKSQSKRPCSSIVTFENTPSLNFANFSASKFLPALNQAYSGASFPTHFPSTCDVRRKPYMEDILGELNEPKEYPPCDFASGLRQPTCNAEKKWHDLTASLPYWPEPSGVVVNSGFSETHHPPSHSDSGYGGTNTLNRLVSPTETKYNGYQHSLNFSNDRSSFHTSLVNPQPFQSSSQGQSHANEKAILIYPLAAIGNNSESQRSDSPSAHSTSILTLAAKLDEKEAELNTLRAAMDRNESAIVRVYEEKLAYYVSQMGALQSELRRYELALGQGYPPNTVPQESAKFEALKSPKPPRYNENSEVMSPDLGALLLRELEECRWALCRKNGEISYLKSQIRNLISDKPQP